ncbi:glycosyltransferase family 2 protein [Candidatus Woesearchaeota archaeon]|nr:glycosyltransferase family 2 protein [Candidatus Woesearchaeota archaeon]
MLPKILIGVPTFDGQKYCKFQFIQSIQSLTYLNADVLVVDNSDHENYAKELEQVKVPYGNLTVLHQAPKGTRIERIIQNRNTIRAYFLEHHYDFLLFLDSDVMAPKDVIEQLIALNSDIASGLYLTRQQIAPGKFDIIPTVYVPHGKDSVQTLSQEQAVSKGAFDILICGLGCTLIKRHVLFALSFHQYNSESSTGSEDVAFCLDAKKNNFSMKATSNVLCDHVGKEQTLTFKPSFSYSLI